MDVTTSGDGETSASAPVSPCLASRCSPSADLYPAATLEPAGLTRSLFSGTNFVAMKLAP
jgi:hypothetical protein